MSDQLISVSNDKGITLKLPQVPLVDHVWHIHSYIDDFVDTVNPQHDLRLVNQTDGSVTVELNILFDGVTPNDNDILYTARQLVKTVNLLSADRETALAGYYK